VLVRWHEAHKNNWQLHKEPYESYIPDEPEYAHVRFGATRDTLLLDVEWHTVESYAEFFARNHYGEQNGAIEEFEDIKNKYLGTDEFIEQFLEYYKNHQSILSREWYPDLSDEEIEDQVEEWVNYRRDEITGISFNRIWLFKTINGIEAFPWTNHSLISYSNITVDTKTRFKYDNYDYYGNYMYHVYPMWIWVGYADENGESQNKNWYIVSKQDFDSITESEVIPFLDDLLARGLIAQTYYDNTIADPLDAAVEAYFPK
jgi:hypothetical protein